MKNTVELLGHYGGDLTHAMSAWTSTKRDITPERLERLPNLLTDQLMGLNTPDHGPAHTSPFEKSALHFLVTTDVATHIHIIKHRIGVSVNAESARYKELKDDKYYIPEDWPVDLKRELMDDIDHANARYHYYVKALQENGFSRSRAKESARYVRPYASQLTQDVMFNFLSFMHFQKLRNDKHAQLEVRDVAQQMLELVRATGDFNASLEAFGYA